MAKKPQKSRSTRMIEKMRIEQPAFTQQKAIKNPVGRPKGLAQMVREITAGGRELVETMYEIARDPKARNADRIHAIQWLSDRGYGKAPETHVNLDVTPTANALSDDELVTLARELKAIKAGPEALLGALPAVDAELIPAELHDNSPSGSVIDNQADRQTGPETGSDDEPGTDQ